MNYEQPTLHAINKHTDTDTPKTMAFLIHILTIANTNISKSTC